MFEAGIAVASIVAELEMKLAGWYVVQLVNGPGIVAVVASIGGHDLNGNAAAVATARNGPALTENVS